MINHQLIKNYSVALFENAINLGIEEKIFQQSFVLNQIISNNLPLKDLLRSPIVSKQDKMRLITCITEFLKADDILKRFVALLIKNSRITSLDEIVSYYKTLFDERKGIKRVRVTSSKELLSGEQNLIIKTLEHDLKSVVDVEFNYNPHIIGGYLIEYDSRLFDCSIAGVLQNINEIRL